VQGRISYFVTTGLDPVVHAETQQTTTLRWSISQSAFRMDCRVKPGNDENANVHLILPREAGKGRTAGMVFPGDGIAS